MSWERLDWDSEQFGFAAARLHVPGATGASDCAMEATQLETVLDECRAAGIRHLIARVDARHMSMIHTLENAGFELLDGIQTFALELDNPLILICLDGLSVRPLCWFDRPQVLTIAKTAYSYDRFHVDSALSQETADRINATWVDNCCRGQMADVVFVAEENHEVLGFVTCKINPKTHVGVIGMVATHASARRRGVARAITSACINWFHENGAFRIEVGTQLANLPATRLYQTMGFRSIAVSLTFRKLL
jgi:dTDP-4-amino-4,6-dideoxy-D-galactose acyltransferase